MPRLSTRRVVAAGLVATLILTLVLAAGPAIGAPPLNLPLWDGTLFTLNLPLAVGFGYLVHFAVGLALASLYVQVAEPRLTGEPWLKGAVFGALVWAALMLVGLPLFDALDPLVANGLMAAPGVFALGLGVTAPLMLLVAHLLYGAVLGQLTGARALPVVRRRAF